MSIESRTIPTLTEFNVAGNEIEIKSYYFDTSQLPNTIACDITETTGSQDNVPFIEGHLLIRVKNWPDQINYMIDANGHLLLFCATGDENNYSINDNSHLTYTS